MSVVYDKWGVRVHHGDCLKVLAELPDASVHSVVTDPPAGVRFMGRAWDTDHGGRDKFVEWLADRMEQAYRVLKPGGHALVWGLPRTSHWTALAVEEAGFEVRDCITHLFGQGFAKSLDVGKAIDRARDDTADVDHVRTWLNDRRLAAGLTLSQINVHFGHAANGGGSASSWTTNPTCRGLPTWEQWQQLRELIGFGDEMDAEVWRLNGRKGTPGEAWLTAEVLRTEDRFNEPHGLVNAGQGARSPVTRQIKAANTDDARRWSGWGTAVKPASEHWWLVRKPFPGTVAGNVLEHGTGALNIDGCRVASDGSHKRAGMITKQTTVSGDERTGAALGMYGAGSSFMPTNHDGGRWPSNVVLSHAALLDPDSGEVVGDACADGCVPGCAVAELDRQSGPSRSPRTYTRKADGVSDQVYGKGRIGERAGKESLNYGDSGGASRFFPVFRWEPKAPPAERPRINGVAHPTVKPLGLGRWLVRLITPPGGTVLDLFAGTGVIGQAARAEGMTAILIEADPASLPLIVARLDALPKSEAPVNGEPVQVDVTAMDLFSLLGADR